MVNYLKKDWHGWSPAGLLLEDTKLLLNSFAQWRINHTRREANAATHFLAKDALNHLEALIDVEVVLDCIHSIVLQETLNFCLSNKASFFK